MRTGHYIQVPKSGHMPACFVAVVVEPLLCPWTPEGSADVPAKGGRVHAVWSRRKGEHWSAEEYGVWDDHDKFWMWLERYAYSGRRTWVVAPVASDALTLLGFWHRVDRLGARFQGQLHVRGSDEQMSRLNPAFTFTRLVMRGKPDIVEYSIHQRRYTWVSLGQFWPFESSPQKTPPSPACSSPIAASANGTLCTSTQQERCEAILRTMRSVSKFWSGLQSGGFARTIGGLSSNFLRSRLTPRSISTHTDGRVQKLERLSCHGGRASSWFYGDCVAAGHVQSPDLPPLPRECPWHLEGELFHVDVSSMYVWLLTQVDTPTKLLSFPPDETVKGLTGLVRWHCVIANVMLDTPVAEYPHRKGERVLYPTGRFRAVLCGQELERALADGIVSQVFSCAIYERGRPFERAGRELLQMRADAKARGDDGWETFVKLLGNSATGKLAQRSAIWQDRPRHPAQQDWGEWPEPDMLTGKVTRYRAVAGMVQELVRDGLSKGTWTACYAFLTAAGRLHMRRVRESLPPRSVVSQDTDGLWVTRAGRDALGAALYETASPPGCLRHVDTSTASRWYSPKHYFASGAWTLAGMHHPVPSSGPLSFFDTWTHNLIRTNAPRPPDWINLHTREVTLGLLPADGSVGEDGWITPHHFGKPLLVGDDPVGMPEHLAQPNLFGAA